MEDLSKQTAIVFGGSGLIGSAICKILSRQGARTVVHFHNNNQAAWQIASEIENSGGKACALHADVTDEQSVASLIDETISLYGSVHMAVNTVHKSSGHRPIRDMEWSDWGVHLDAFKGHFIICKSVLPIMREQKYGRIVYLSGGLSHRYFEGCAPYSTIKAGLNSFCKTLALEEGGHNITVNIVAPGKVVEPTEKAIEQRAARDELGNRSAAENPLKRFATPDDVAEAVLYFASPHTSGITGQTIFVAGGEIMP